MSLGPRRLGLLLVGVLVAALLVVVIPGVAAALAPPDTPSPSGADGLAQDIRASFSSAIDLRVPAYRVAIRSWQRVGSHSYLASIEVYDLLFGLGSRRALVAAACWEAGRTFAGGWVDDPQDEAEMRADFESAANACP